MVEAAARIRSDLSPSQRENVDLLAEGNYECAIHAGSKYHDPTRPEDDDRRISSHLKVYLKTSHNEVINITTPTPCAILYSIYNVIINIILVLTVERFQRNISLSVSMPFFRHPPWRRNASSWRPWNSKLDSRIMIPRRISVSVALLGKLNDHIYT